MTNNNKHWEDYALKKRLEIVVIALGLVLFVAVVVISLVSPEMLSSDPESDFDKSIRQGQECVEAGGEWVSTTTLGGTDQTCEFRKYEGEKSD